MSLPLVSHISHTFLKSLEFYSKLVGYVGGAIGVVYAGGKYLVNRIKQSGRIEEGLDRLVVSSGQINAKVDLFREDMIRMDTRVELITTNHLPHLESTIEKMQQTLSDHIASSKFTGEV
ncbi:MAG: hypothetical protein ACREQ5_12780 [Candidatus Dormibacteria bacterium]